MPFLNPKLGIDFTDYIADRTTNFIGRKWVFEAIQTWLADPKGDRFFLLTGEPGSGKTAIAARLTQFAQGVVLHPRFDAGFLHAVHFCSARDSVWTDPKEFVRSIALQLAQSIPEFGLALKDIGEKTTNINVDMSVGTAQNSTIQGVVIQNLTISGLTGQEAFTQVVVNPLRQIREEGFNYPVTILVDSLDEALTHDGESTIVGLLSTLSSGVKIRLILTSRNEARVKEKLVAYEELFLSAEENLDKNQQDIRVYIDSKFEQEEMLKNSLQAEALAQEILTTNLLEKSEGNFLYVRFLLESVALGQQNFANLDGLPQGLSELYYSSLGRVVELGKKDWSEVYAPVIGVLLAAQKSLTYRQIRAFTKLKESVVWDCLNDLRQFLDEIESEDEETLYKLYHQSVTDFLGKRQLVIRKKKLNNRYYLPSQEQHQRIVDYYLDQCKNGWLACDEYGLNYVIQHVVSAKLNEEEFGKIIDKILTPDFMDARLKQTGWHMPFIRDLHRIAILAPKQTVDFCLQIIYEKHPISSVTQNILRILIEVRGKVGKINHLLPSLDAIIDSTIVALINSSEKAGYQLTQLLQQVENERIKSVIVLALGETHSSVAIATLINILKTSSPQLRWSAADALVCLNDSSIVPELIQWFDKAHSGDQERILYTLGHMQATEARILLSKSLEHSSARVVGRSIDLMCQLKPVKKEDEDFLLQKLSLVLDGNNSSSIGVWADGWVQQRLVTALGRIGSAKARECLQKFREIVINRPEPQSEKLQLQQKIFNEKISLALAELQNR
jgi:hypothetical protein